MELEQFPTGRTGLLQLSMARGAELVVRPDLLLAPRAIVSFFDILQKRFFLESSFISLGERLLRPQHEIQNQPWHIEDDDHQSGQQLGEDVPRPRADISECPDYEADPEREKEGA